MIYRVGAYLGREAVLCHETADGRGIAGQRLTGMRSDKLAQEIVGGVPVLSIHE
jgi:hypothetical protein